MVGGHLFTQYRESYYLSDIREIVDASDAANGSYASSVRPVLVPAQAQDDCLLAVFKCFAHDRLPELKLEVLEELVVIARGLTASLDHQILARNIAWPVAVVRESEADQRIVGYVMPEHASTKGLCGLGVRWPSMDVLQRSSALTKISKTEFYSDGESIARLGKLAGLIDRLHSIDISVGDLALENALMSPLGYQPAVLLVDADSFVVHQEQCSPGYRVLASDAAGVSDWRRYYVACSRSLGRHKGILSLTGEQLAGIFPNETDQAMLTSMFYDDTSEITRDRVLALERRWAGHSPHTNGDRVTQYESATTQAETTPRYGSTNWWHETPVIIALSVMALVCIGLAIGWILFFWVGVAVSIALAVGAIWKLKEA